MGAKALIKGEVYIFLERIPSLGEDGEMILCTNASGEKYVCTDRVWQKI